MAPMVKKPAMKSAPKEEKVVTPATKLAAPAKAARVDAGVIKVKKKHLSEKVMIRRTIRSNNCLSPALKVTEASLGY